MNRISPPLRRRLPVVLSGLLVLLASCGGPADEGELFQRGPTGTLPTASQTYGGTLLDWDGDGGLDLLASLHTDRAEVFLNRGGLRFEHLAPGPERPARQRDNHGASACDFDGDGDWDIFVSLGADSGDGFGYNQLWRQTAAGQFDDQAAGQELLTDPVGRGRGGLWSDFDGDHRPELLIFNYRSQARLAAWDGADWHDVTARLPWPPSVPLHRPGRPPPGDEERARAGWVHTAVAADFNGDMQPDLLALGRPAWSGLWLNTRQGQFLDLSSASGLRPALWPQVPRFATAGDLDEDNDLDLVLIRRAEPDMAPDRPLVETWLNESVPGEVRFRPLAGLSPAALAEVHQPESCLLADLDNDGHLDLYLVQRPTDQGQPPNRLFRGRGDGSFEDQSKAWGGRAPAGTASESAWAVDLDHDGDLDLMTFNGGDGETARPGGIVVYENRSDAQRGLTLYLSSETGTPHGLGAQVILAQGGPRQLRVGSCIVSAVASSVLPVHLGVGTQTGPFKIGIRWAGGREQIVRLPEAGRAYHISEGRPQAVMLAPVGDSAGAAADNDGGG